MSPLVTGLLVPATLGAIVALAVLAVRALVRLYWRKL